MSGSEPIAGRRAATRRVWRTCLIAAGFAVAANLVLFLTSGSAGVSFLVEIPNRGRQEITAASVVLLTAVPMGLGAAVAAFASARMRHGLRLVQVAGAAVAVASLAAPLSIEAQTATKLVLAAMHVLTGAAFVAGLWAAPRAGEGRGPR